MRLWFAVLLVGCSGGDERAGVLTDGAGGGAWDAGTGGAQSTGGRSSGGADAAIPLRSCVDNSDCGDTDVCVAQACQPSCESDDDCPSDWLCVRRMDRGKQCRPACSDTCDDGQCVPFIGDECAAKPECGDPSTWRFACNTDNVCAPTLNVLFVHCSD